MMSLSKRQLLDFLAELDRELDDELTVVAAGGTAMTLYNFKPSTIDVDLTIPAEYLSEFHRVLDLTPRRFKVETWSDGMLFSQDLPGDYLEKSRPARAKMKNTR